jgi:hypothetical protein
MIPLPILNQLSQDLKESHNSSTSDQEFFILYQNKSAVQLVPLSHPAAVQP